jgi:hypothetical protein
MTAEELADKIYEAAGMIVNDEQALGIGKLIVAARDNALDEAAMEVAAEWANENGLTHFEIMNRDQEMIAKILALKGKYYD